MRKNRLTDQPAILPFTMTAGSPQPLAGGVITIPTISSRKLAAASASPAVSHFLQALGEVLHVGEVRLDRGRVNLDRGHRFRQRR